MQDFRNLKVWQKAHELALVIYRITAGFPKEEVYGLTSQMRRAAGSVPANLAEGCCRQGDSEFGRFAQISLGSLSELEYHLLLAKDLGFVVEAEYECFARMVEEVKRMLIAFIQTLRGGRAG